MMLIAATLFGLLALIVSVIWKLLPVDLKEIYQGKRGRFNTIFFCFVLFFYIITGLVDELYLRRCSGFIRFAGIVLIISFAIFLWWSLVKRSTTKAIITGSVIFTLFIPVLLFFNFVSFESGKIAEDSGMEKLSSLPYLSWISAEKDIDKTGVVQSNPKLALDGLNLYGSYIVPEAYLLDMNGNIVHKWSKKVDGCDNWKEHVELCKNGDLLIVAVDRMIICLDWDSNVKWKQKLRVHHDVFPDEDKQKFYVLAREDAIVHWHGIPIPIVSDYIAILSPDKGLERKIYLYGLVKDKIKPSRIVGLYTGIFRFKEIVKFFVRKIQVNWVCQHSMHFDIMHVNSVEVLNRSIKGFCEEGDLLVSIRELDLVAVIDIDKEEFVWTWGPGEVIRQHDAQLLENGNLLVFDNGGLYSRQFSRVVEMNPLTRKIVWEYKSDPEENFFSFFCGSSQRLSNGNTLIAESGRGRAFEITKDGKIVWEYYNPNVEKEVKKRAAIHRIRRITDPQIRKLVKNTNMSKSKSQ